MHIITATIVFEFNDYIGFEFVFYLAERFIIRNPVRKCNRRTEMGWLALMRKRDFIKYKDCVEYRFRKNRDCVQIISERMEIVYERWRLCRDYI